MRIVVVLSLIIFNLAIAGIIGGFAGGYSETYRDYNPDQNLEEFTETNFTTALFDLILEATGIFWLDILVIRPTQLIIGYEVVQHIPGVGS